MTMLVERPIRQLNGHMILNGETALREPAPAAPASWTPTDRAVSDLTAARLIESVPPNTRRAYRYVADSFTDWCRPQDRVSLPATGETLAEYVSALITKRRAPATIEHHIGAIRKLHSIAGHQGSPDGERAQQLLRGWRRAWAEDGNQAARATPLLPTALRSCIEVLDLETRRGRRDQLLLVLGFALMARRSELAALRLADVTETEDGLLVQIRTSKTDKNSEGATVAVPPGSHPELDPVRLVREWREDLARDGEFEGALLRGVSRSGALLCGISSRTVCRIVQRSAARAGLPDAHRYSGHSLRSGGLTGSLRAGTPLGVAADHGRWSPTSPVVVAYARAADRWRDNAMRGVL